LALTFGTLLSSQGTVASFVLTLSGFPPGFPSVVQTLPVFFRPSDHSPAGMRKMILSEDLTSLGAARMSALYRSAAPQAGVRLYTELRRPCKSTGLVV
ncbi:hypothetical protein AB0M11_41230, partial [Streptomyces sp. NPDC051987]|uniref:hypothetical protein n=1 Tax=Streptomyces sp. NPDC051987 TaxID=3155808 RepID=UPI00341C4D21